METPIMISKLTAFMLAVAITVAIFTGAHSYSNVVYIKDDPGGLIGEYAMKYGRIMQRGEYVHISGYCASACTMVLILPRHRICAEPDAVFAFHSPTTIDGKIDPELSWQFFRQFYPPSIQRRLAARPLTTDLLKVAATTLVPECKP
jgi:hypothetical protein